VTWRVRRGKKRKREAPVVEPEVPRVIDLTNT
jgi:hypothetical protein